MDRPVVHRSSLPHAWSQPYPHSPPQSHTYPHPPAPQYPSHDQHNPYTAHTLYPTVVGQQMPLVHSQPQPNAFIRPRGKSTVGDSNPYFDQPAPAFPSPAPPHFPQAHLFTYNPVPPSNPPALQPQSSGFSFPIPNQLQDVVPIRPSPTFTRRSSSSPAINRIPAPDVPPPIPPLPPTYHLSNHQHTPHRLSPAPPSIPIPSPVHSYRSDSASLYDSPYETSSPPPFSPPPQTPISSPPPFPSSSPPKFESDVKHAPVDEEEEALALAIALSEKESMAHSGKVSQEEDDLARAIEESMKHTSSFGVSVSPAEAGPSTFPRTTSPLPVSEPPIPPYTHLTTPNTSHVPTSRPASNMSSPLMHPTKLRTSDDEALAQRLAEEEEIAAIPGPSNPKPESPVLPSPRPDIITPPAPAPSSVSRKRQESNQSKFFTADSEPPPPMYHHVISAQTSASAKTSPTLTNKNTALGRSSSASVVPLSTGRLSPIPGPADKPNAGRSQTVDTASSSSNSAGSSPSVLTTPSPLQTVEESSDSPTVQSPSSSTGPVPPNSFIDQQLLNGVSLGFNPPQISSIKTTLKGGVPNVISLPNGKFVPFHIQAPDWRHLLKMMARLSGSRIEASVEALAGTKQELKLRTIVQFVRVNATSQDWRTVIYLTIDNPPPSNAPHKFTNGDVNTLPFSYTTSSLPALLRDGPDAPMSKYYTIPATPNTPYPTLPISFPNMAMYLASAVEDSRRLAHDNSSGMKRLAKTMDMLYPALVELGMEDDEPDKPPGGVVNMFRNVFGRGRKDQRRNDDNYADLVTPFVPEWG